MLNRIKSFRDVRDAIARDDVGKFDVTLPIESVRMRTDNGAIYNTLLDPSHIDYQRPALLPNDHALGQLLQRTGIDVRYGRKAFAADPYLIAEHVNYWIESGELPGIKDANDVSERKWFLRGKNNMLRAVLTDRYGQLDNEFAFSALSTVLKDESSVRDMGFFLDPKYLNARMVFPQLKVNLGTLQNPDLVFVGFHFVNSEVGCSSVRIDCCLYRQVCSNGMIVRVDGEMLLQQRHANITQNELQNRVAEALTKAIKVGDGAIQAFAKSREVKVEDPLELISKLAKTEKYSQAFTDTIKDSFQSEPGDTAYHVVNAFTHAAKSLPIEQRLEVETFAGKFMQNVEAYM